MNFTKTLIAVAILSLAPSSFAAEAIATVNGKQIKQSVYDVITKDITASGQKVDDNT
jgi:peptidyl-prolyl cis-trans isomerase C